MDTTRWFRSLIGMSLLAHVGAACWIESQPQRLPEIVVTPPETAIEVSFVEIKKPEPQTEPEPILEPPPPKLVPEPEPIPEPEPELAQPEPVPQPAPEPEPAPVVEPPPVVAKVESLPEPPPPAPQPKPVETMESVVIQEARPQYDLNPPPRYPRVARERGWQGTALLRVEVLSSGQAGQITILESSGYRMLDEVSVEAVRGWKFQPARRGDDVLPSWVEVPINFKLM